MFSQSEALSRATHELRTPLNAILGFGQLLALDQLNESQRHNVEQILAGGRHLLALIEDLVDLSRAGADQLECSRELVDVGEQIRQAAALSAPLAAERSVTVRVEEPEQPCTILADRTRLTQILLNLISNAIKYNRAGGSVVVQARAKTADGLCIDVIDTGRGMTRAELRRLFVPFERLGAARRGIEGNGLGLVVSKALAEAMGGGIEVASTPHVGSVFTLRLPCAPAGMDARTPALAGVA
jgi:signal transduction histidine kinase